MPGVVTMTPPATKAAMIRAVLAEKHPRLALPTIASHFSVTLADLQTILNQNGYPETAQLRSAIERLERAQETSTTDGDAGGRHLVDVDVTKVHPDPENVRGRNMPDIEELADSIKEAGLLQPIVVRRTSSGQLIVVAGHRRLAAVKHLRWAKIPVIINADMRPDEVLAAMLIENGQRADLDPIEEARGLHRLRAQMGGDEACSEVELARRIGRSLAYVNGRLLLLNLSAEDQQAVREGRFGVTAATQRGRMNSGRLRNGAVGRVPGGLHLSSGHDLADRARSRCTRLQHSKGKSVGGIACGECWESVIRADEREHLQEITSSTNVCPVCGSKNHDPKGTHS